MPDKWDDMEVNLTRYPPGHPKAAEKLPRPVTWEQREIEALMRPGRRPDGLRERLARRREAVRRKP